MRTSEAAEYLRLSASTLQKMRISGSGPTFSKSGSRIIVYDRAHLDEWLRKREHHSTSEYGAAPSN
ncbi:helix-turn-helix domain-containing protein [Pseudaminobacter sp. 19-2017]|uniref:Helix-turn-helix domain-containing protein n=1 Tax=Pseudaminobacter soli (ex Zhang et al. 2022) TaxID=2831468 RepID=A0A942DY27_9HYPH|nr:helix-turn-helix domain-containing protein [Pseudaminobacter soli]MBS3650039.1 helix-turn-helix domain-containing protein [Pseudaminobacter soli]